MLQANLAKARAAMAVKALLAFVQALLAAFFFFTCTQGFEYSSTVAPASSSSHPPPPLSHLKRKLLMHEALSC